jgi:hypothetical protein
MTDLLLDEIPLLCRAVPGCIEENLGLVAACVEDGEFGCWGWWGAFDTGDADPAIDCLLAAMEVQRKI